MKRHLTTLLFALMAIISTAVYGQDYDLVINNGRVMDPETGFDAVANVGVKDGMIASITTETLDGIRNLHTDGKNNQIKGVLPDLMIGHGIADVQGIIAAAAVDVIVAGFSEHDVGAGVQQHARSPGARF